jgi:hypothetical protein
MSRRRLLFGLLLASAVLACFAGWLVMASSPRVTRATFELVKEGMSREQVYRTVGGPPDDYATITEHGLFEAWMCDDACLLVQFNADGKATDVGIMNTGGRPLTLTERIRLWLGL